MSVYDSIIAGLTEAIEDAQREQTTLKCHVRELEADDAKGASEHNHGQTAGGWFALPFLENTQSSSSAKLGLTMKTSAERPYVYAVESTSSTIVGLNPQREENVRSVWLPCAA